MSPASCRFLLITLLFCNNIGYAEEPALPAGLESPTPRENSDPDEPSLPTGLNNEDEPSPPTGLSFDEPGLPAGLESETPDEPGLPEGITTSTSNNNIEPVQFVEPNLNIDGFLELRAGHRLHDDSHERDTSLLESRIQLEIEKYLEFASFKLTTDLLYDNVADSYGIDLDTGNGWLDLREAFISAPVTDFLDIKTGRQILTWGTGDLLFINDMFPKDWNAFFIGRDVEYLKAPSDAIKLAFYSDIANLDLIYTPEFDADRFIDGRRLSYYAAPLGRLAGRDAIIRTIRPDDAFSDDEWALRLYRNIAAYETALYAYHGFWKSPGGMDAVSGRAIFPELSVYGASIRGPIFKGIGNTEIGYYDSHDDDNGTNPLINNSEFRVLIGYEQEIKRNLTAGFQYYLEHLLDYDNYRSGLPTGIPNRDENRHLFTLRLTLLTHSQNVNWSLFSYYSPSDRDFYLRPHVLYKLDDNWSIEAGGNLFGGDNKHSFFGQFEDNSNMFGSIRYYY